MNSELKHKLIRRTFILTVFALFGFMFWPFFTAILLAALFAFALHDLVGKVQRPKLNRSWSSLLVLGLLLLFIALPLLFISVKTVSTVRDYAAVGITNTSVYQQAAELAHKATDYGIYLAEKIGMDVSTIPKPIEFLEDYAGNIGAFATGFLAKLPRVLMNLLVFFLALYYFLNESVKIKKLFLKFDLLSESEMNRIIGVVKNSSYLSLTASLAIAFTQAFIISTFAMFCGFSDFFLVFIITFVFALVPVVGCAPPALFLILASFVQGNTGAGIAMIVAFVIASTSDNVIKIYLLNSSNDDIHPILSLLALIGGLLVYGAPGILLGPVLTQLAFNIMPILAIEENSGDFQPQSDL